MITARVIRRTGHKVLRALMKHSSVLIVLFLAVSASALYAQPYTFDGNGNGTLAPFFEPSPMPFQVTSDPTGGITTSPVLIYSLEAKVVSGDVALTNPDGTVADLIRFFTPFLAQTSIMIFYSQTNDSYHTLADVGIPDSATPYRISKVSPTTVWDPVSPSQPGYGVGTYPIFDIFRYNIMVVPEPSLSLSGTNLIWKINGPTNLEFCVIAATNLSLAMPNWTAVSTNTIDQTGHCTLTLPIEPDKPQRFYRLSYPVN